jgi:hypothetical protein
MANSSIFFPDLTNPTKIGSIEVDILIEQEHKLESDVTEHPVEDGFAVADHVIRKAIKVSMVVGVTLSPVTWLDRLGSATDKITNALAAFEQIYKNAQPITIVTPTNMWENMIMTSASIPRNIDNKNLIKIPCEFTQIRRVNVKSTDIPQNIVDLDMINRAGETEADGGTATQTDVGNVNDTEDTGTSGQTETRQSTLKSLKNSFFGR